MTKNTVINLSLIQDFDLSDKAVFMYGCLAETHRFNASTPVSITILNRNLFGDDSKRRQTLRRGMDELIAKGLVKEQDKGMGRTPFYDLTMLDTYPKKKYVIDQYGFISQWKDHHKGLKGSSKCLISLYKIYLTLKWMLDVQKKTSKDKILKTYKVTIAKNTGTQRKYVNEKLKFFLDNEIFDYVDVADLTVRGRKAEPTIYLTDFKNKSELDYIKALKQEAINDLGFYRCRPIAV